MDTENNDKKIENKENKKNEENQIVETFKREDIKISELEEQIKSLSIQVKKIEKQIPEQKKSLFFKIIIISLLLSISYGGYWLYNQENKSQALAQVGEVIIEQKNALSQKISQASTNISNAEIQEQIDDLKKQNILFSTENKVLRDEISGLIEKLDQQKNEGMKNKVFMISQLESQINFLKKGDTQIITPEITPEEIVEENTEKFENTKKPDEVEEISESENKEINEIDASIEKLETPEISEETVSENTEEKL